MYVKSRRKKWEELHMKPNNHVSWVVDDKKYIIYNVLFEIYEEYTNDEIYSSDTTLKLLLLKDLMEANEIPSKIDFQDSIDIALE